MPPKNYHLWVQTLLYFQKIMLPFTMHHANQDELSCLPSPHRAKHPYYIVEISGVHSDEQVSIEILKEGCLEERFISHHTQFSAA